MITNPRRLLAPPPSKPHLFQKGHPGGPGRPKSLTKLEYLTALQKAIKPKDLQTIMRRVYDIALNPKTSASNVLRAAKYLTDVYCGKDPVVQLNISEKPKEIDAIFEALAKDDDAKSVAS